MTLVNFKAQNHTQQVRKRGANPVVDDRATPPEVFDPLHERFGFTVDVAALPHNAKLPKFFTPEQNGLEQAWAGERVWCNPPFSDIQPWVCKAWREMDNGAELIVMLLPANRTEQTWWQDLVEPYRDEPSVYKPNLTVEFLKGRLRFIHVGETEVLPNQRPPFGCCLLIFEQPAYGRKAA